MTTDVPALRHRAHRSDSLWDAVPLETELALQADRIVGASDAFLMINDTGLPKRAITQWEWRRNMPRCWAREQLLEAGVGVDCTRRSPGPGWPASFLAGAVIRSAWRRPGSQKTWRFSQEAGECSCRDRSVDRDRYPVWHSAG